MDIPIVGRSKTFSRDGDFNICMKTKPVDCPLEYRLDDSPPRRKSTRLRESRSMNLNATLKFRRASLPITSFTRSLGSFCSDKSSPLNRSCETTTNLDGGRSSTSVRSSTRRLSWKNKRRFSRPETSIDSSVRGMETLDFHSQSMPMFHRTISKPEEPSTSSLKPPKMPIPKLSRRSR